MALPEPTPRQTPQSISQSIHFRGSCDNNAETVWSPAVSTMDTCLNRSDEARMLPRRASFSGVVPSGGNNKDAVRWQGTLPPRCLDLTAGVSPKVFFGGLPWDITEQTLNHTLRHFQPLRVEWPVRDAGSSAGGSSSAGFAHVTFKSEGCVRALQSASRREGNDLYYRIQGRKMRKDAQVIPWFVCDATWVRGGGMVRLDPKRTVFVGALHGMLTAATLAKIMDDLFSGVISAGIDTNKNKYPIGSGRVIFNNEQSYSHAVSTGFIEIITNKFTKKVQVMPYLEDSMCSVCNLKLGAYFCREPTCYRYFCRLCWAWQHRNEEHKPLTRNFKPQLSGFMGHPHYGNTPAHHSSSRDERSVNTGYYRNMEGTPSPSMSGSLYEPVTGSCSKEPDLPPLRSNLHESVSRGQSWDDDTGPSGQGITNLVASLNAMALPEPTPRQTPQSISQSIHFRGSCDNNAETVWSPAVSTMDTCLNRSDEARMLPRRASFSGVVPSGGNNKDAVRWQGTLPPRCLDLTAGVSPKVFFGGLPWDITEQTLNHTLRHFQPLRVEWPVRDAGSSAGGSSSAGFAHVTFKSEGCVRALQSASRREGNDLYYRIQGRKMRKDAQVIPWFVCDATWVRGGGMVRLDPKRTVFVGALHGMLTAATLAKIMDDLFSGVISAGIDTNKNKYPIGSGRVIFNNEQSYSHAVSTGFIEIITNKFTKKVQVMPYLEDSMCSVCNLKLGAYFCREPTCYRYFCRLCWAWQHRNEEHKPLTRNFNPQLSGFMGHPHYGNTPAHHSSSRDERSVNTGYYRNMEGTPSPSMSGSLYEPVTGSCSKEPDLPPLRSNLQ